jgi:hypothetical protein
MKYESISSGGLVEMPIYFPTSEQKPPSLSLSAKKQNGQAKNWPSV